MVVRGDSQFLFGQYLVTSRFVRLGSISFAHKTRSIVCSSSFTLGIGFSGIKSPLGFYFSDASISPM